LTADELPDEEATKQPFLAFYDSSHGLSGFLLGLSLGLSQQRRTGIN
jgi:hypothetical protein